MGKTFRSHERFDDEYDEYTKKRHVKEKGKKIKEFVEKESHRSDKMKSLEEFDKPTWKKDK